MSATGVAAVLRLWCNGWCTGSRFGHATRCRFGCGHDQDSIRHFASCRIVRSLLQESLLGREQAPARFLRHGGPGLTDDELANWAVGVYGLCRTHNLSRHGAVPAGDVAGVFHEYCSEARRGQSRDEDVDVAAEA